MYWIVSVVNCTVGEVTLPTTATTNFTLVGYIRTHQSTVIRNVVVAVAIVNDIYSVVNSCSRFVISKHG